MTPSDTDKGGIIGGRAWFRVSPRPDCTVVTVGGEVDMQSTATLARTLESVASSAVPPCLVIDLTHLSFLDSSGLGVIISARNYALARGVSLALVHPPGLVRRVLTDTRLQESFAIYDSIDDALAVLNAG
jgi:anti-anti-sigma factor